MRNIEYVEFKDAAANPLTPLSLYNFPERLSNMDLQQYWSWTVLEQIFNGKPGKYVKVRCKCGTEKVHYLSDIKTGRSKQCSSCQYKMLYNPAREIGKKYGKWLITEFYDMHRKLQRFKCICECGTIAIQVASELRSGKSKQCTLCHNKEVCKMSRTNPKGRKQSKNSLEYSVWSGMHRRCYNTKCSRYKDYGARGITIHERWHTFKNFLEDMGPRPLGYTIDRINNNGNYEPGNCRWVTIQDNIKNKGR